MHALYNSNESSAMCTLAAPFNFKLKDVKQLGTY